MSIENTLTGALRVSSTVACIPAQGVEWCLWSFVWFFIKDHDTDSRYVTSRLAMNKLGVKLLMALLSIKYFKNLWHNIMHEVISNSQYLWHTLANVVSPLSAANFFYAQMKPVKVSMSNCVILQPLSSCSVRQIHSITSVSGPEIRTIN